MVKKTDIIMDEYIDVLEKIKERITQAVSQDLEHFHRESTLYQG